MQIIECDARHRLEWNQFVLRCSRASFYHRCEWQDINQRCFGHATAYLAAIEGDTIHGVFPLVRLKSLLFGNVACSLPFVNYGGPAGDTDIIERALLDAGAEVARRWGVEYLEIRSQRHLGFDMPSSAHKVSLTVNLDRDPDKVWTSYRSSTGPRQDIRRGYKNGLRAQFGGVDLLEPFYAIISESWRDLGTPIYCRTYLETVLRTFSDVVRICVVSSADGTPAAAAFYGHHRDVAEGLWLGVRSRFRRDMAGYVLYWEIIKDACERGYSRFHLGRSTAESGGEQFKKKWNAEPLQLYWQYVLRTGTTVPTLNPGNPRYRLAIEAWRRLPIPVTQALGPYLAKSIP